MSRKRQGSSIIRLADFEIDGFILKQFNGEAKPLNGLIQILAIDRLRAVVNVSDELGGGKRMVTRFGKQVMGVHGGCAGEELLLEETASFGIIKAAIELVAQALY